MSHIGHLLMVLTDEFGYVFDLLWACCGHGIVLLLVRPDYSRAGLVRKMLSIITYATRLSNLQITDLSNDIEAVTIPH